MYPVVQKAERQGEKSPLNHWLSLKMPIEARAERGRLRQTEASSLELNPGLPPEWQGPKNLRHHLHLGTHE